MASFRASLRNLLPSWLHPWGRSTAGQDLIEYVLLASFIAVVVVGAASGLGTSVDRWFGAVASVFASAPPAVPGSSGGEDGGGDGGAGGSNCSAQGQASSGGKCL